MRKTCLHDRKYNVSNPRFGDIGTGSAIEAHMKDMSELSKSAKTSASPRPIKNGRDVPTPVLTRFIKLSIVGYAGHRPSFSQCNPIVQPS